MSEMYKISSSRLTELANGVRKNTGLADALSPSDMVRDLLAAPAPLGDVPDYVRAEAERVAKIVRTQQTDTTLTFVALADLHVSRDAQSRESALHALQGAALVSRMVGADFTCVLGDWAQGNADDTHDTQLDNLTQAMTLAGVLSPDMRLQGDGDVNILSGDGPLTPAEVDAYTTRYNLNVVKADQPDSGWFCRDFTKQKVRVICLNTADAQGQNPADTAALGLGYHISAEQFHWLIGQMDMAGKDDWRLLLLSHHPCDTIPTSVASSALCTVIDAYNDGVAGSITIDGETIPFDFSGKNNAVFLAQIHGHTHNLLVQAQNGVTLFPRIATPNACFDRNNFYSDASYPAPIRRRFAEDVAYPKTAGTAQDTALCVYVIDPETLTIRATCYGAGYDRGVARGPYAAALFTEDAAWSADDGALETDVPCHVAFEALPFARNEGEVVGAELSGIDWTHDERCVVALQKGDDVLFAAPMNEPMTDDASGLTVEHGVDGSVILTIGDPLDATFAGADRFKVCGMGRGAKARIAQW